jgi:GGDEF domain-containing protein
MGLKGAGRRLFAAMLLLIAMSAAAATVHAVPQLDPARQPVAMQDWADAWIDAGGQARAESVAEDRSIAWTPTHHGTHYPIGAGQALWIRFVIPAAPDAERWYLEIPYASVDLVTLFTPDSGGQWTGQSAGDKVSVTSWPVPFRYPMMPLLVSADAPRNYLLRVENPYGFSAPLSFVSESYVSRHEQRTSLVLGIFFGVAGLAVMLALLSAFSLRDPAYGLYGLAVALMTLTQASMTGLAGLHLWPHWPWWNDVAALVLPLLSVGAMLWFFSAVVSMRERSPRLYRLVQALVALSLVAAIGVALVAPSYRFAIVVPYITLAATLGALSLLWAARRGDRYGMGLLLGALPVLIGSAFPLARLAGLIPISFWTMHGMQIGIACQLPVLLVTLMMRSQQRREHQRRVQGLDRVDPATGLINGHVFGVRLARMIARSQRLKHQSAVLLVDIVNMDQIRRDFDRRAAEELPLLVAGRLLSAAREIDSVARLSELRFGMLVEGPLSAENAAVAGQRVVARCLMPFKNRPLDWVAQVRVVQTLVPASSGTDAAGVQARLEALLAAVPPDSKRAVFTLRT